MSYLDSPNMKTIVFSPSLGFDHLLPVSVALCVRGFGMKMVAFSCFVIYLCYHQDHVDSEDTEAFFNLFLC